MGPGKVQSILAYLEKYCEATTAYNDLRPFAERLASEDRVLLVRTLTGNLLYGDSEKLRDEHVQVTGKLCPSREDVSYILGQQLSELLVRIRLGSTADKLSFLLPILLLN
jgi:hypothetical protein